ADRSAAGVFGARRGWKAGLPRTSCRARRTGNVHASASLFLALDECIKLHVVDGVPSFNVKQLQRTDAPVGFGLTALGIGLRIRYLCGRCSRDDIAGSLADGECGPLAVGLGLIARFKTMTVGDVGPDELAWRNAEVDVILKSRVPVGKSRG